MKGRNKVSGTLVDILKQGYESGRDLDSVPDLAKVLCSAKLKSSKPYLTWFGQYSLLVIPIRTILDGVDSTPSDEGNVVITCARGSSRNYVVYGSNKLSEVGSLDTITIKSYFDASEINRLFYKADDFSKGDNKWYHLYLKLKSEPLWVSAGGDHNLEFVNVS